MKAKLVVKASKDLEQQYIKYYENLGYKLDSREELYSSIRLSFILADKDKYLSNRLKVKSLKPNISFSLIVIPSLLAFILLTIYLVLFLTKINSFSPFYYLMIPALVCILFATVMSVLKFYFTVANYKILTSR